MICFAASGVQVKGDAKMNRKTLLVILMLVALALIFVGLTGCSILDLFDRNDGRIEVLQSEKPRDTSPQVEEAELTELVAGSSAFAFGLYQALRGEEGNLFYLFPL